MGNESGRSSRFALVGAPLAFLFFIAGPAQAADEAGLVKSANAGWSIARPKGVVEVYVVTVTSPSGVSTGEDRAQAQAWVGHARCAPQRRCRVTLKTIRLQAGQFDVDPLTGDATLVIRFLGKPLKVLWDGVGNPTLLGPDPYLGSSTAGFSARLTWETRAWGRHGATRLSAHQAERGASTHVSSFVRADWAVSFGPSSPRPVSIEE